MTNLLDLVAHTRMKQLIVCERVNLLARYPATRVTEPLNIC
jgi:hypothetical protein